MNEEQREMIDRLHKQFQENDEAVQSVFESMTRDFGKTENKVLSISMKFNEIAEKHGVTYSDIMKTYFSGPKGVAVSVLGIVQVIAIQKYGRQHGWSRARRFLMHWIVNEMLSAGFFPKEYRELNTKGLQALKEMAEAVREEV